MVNLREKISELNNEQLLQAAQLHKTENTANDYTQRRYDLILNELQKRNLTR